MEGKSPAISVVMMGVLLMGLVFSHTPVEAKTTKSCCKSTAARECYNACHSAGAPRYVCPYICKCLIISGTKCPPAYRYLNFVPNTEIGGETNIEEAYTTSDFCKLGCVSSVCSNIMALQESTAGLVSELQESVKVVAENCNNACLDFCNKKSDTAVVAAI
ncbi:hypothetical protein MKX03_031714 [Papaver bracteatum]|nr:hypothetical protein MKX03_031714 [Papaver bracteatum]